MDEPSLRQLLEQGLSLAEIGRRFGKDASTIGYWVRKHGLDAVGSKKHRPRGGLDRSEVERLVDAGASKAVIAKTLGVSETSVSYWLRKWRMQTHAAVRRSHARAAKEAGKAIARLHCRRHGLTEFWLEGRGSYRCMKCRGEWVARRRRKVKRLLVEEAGGRCVLCGYDRCISALHFHHVDPTTKSFALGHEGQTRGIASMRDEARKCMLVCANCHTEVEAGIVAIDGESHPVPHLGIPG